MSLIYENLAAKKNWVNGQAVKLNLSAEPIYELITSNGSLTKSLMALGNNTFNVNVLEERIALPYFHEQQKLNRPLHHWAMIRRVELKIHDQAVVYARSIIPLSLMTKGQSGIVNLGGKPLGHLLFKHGQISTSKRQFSNVTIDENRIFARRTPYNYMNSTILVSEFFLPSIAKYL